MKFILRKSLGMDFGKRKGTPYRFYGDGRIRQNDSNEASGRTVTQGQCESNDRCPKNKPPVCSLSYNGSRIHLVWRKETGIRDQRTD